MLVSNWWEYYLRSFESFLNKYLIFYNIWQHPSAYLIDGQQKEILFESVWSVKHLNKKSLRQKVGILFHFSDRFLSKTLTVHSCATSQHEWRRKENLHVTAFWIIILQWTHSFFCEMTWLNYSRVRNRRRAGNKRRAWKIWQKE